VILEKERDKGPEKRRSMKYASFPKFHLEISLTIIDNNVFSCGNLPLTSVEEVYIIHVIMHIIT